MIEIRALKSQSGHYTEIIEIKVPVRFYWDADGFDGIEFGPFEKELMPWEEEMTMQCLEVIKGAIHA